MKVRIKKETTREEFINSVHTSMSCSGFTDDDFSNVYECIRGKQLTASVTMTGRFKVRVNTEVVEYIYLSFLRLTTLFKVLHDN